MHTSSAYIKTDDDGAKLLIAFNQTDARLFVWKGSETAQENHLSIHWARQVVQGEGWQAL